MQPLCAALAVGRGGVVDVALPGALLTCLLIAATVQVDAPATANIPAASTQRRDPRGGLSVDGECGLAIGPASSVGGSCVAAEGGPARRLESARFIGCVPLCREARRAAINASRICVAEAYRSAFAKRSALSITAATAGGQLGITVASESTWVVDVNTSSSGTVEAT
jgi:hypothetical protein